MRRGSQGIEPAVTLRRRVPAWLAAALCVVCALSCFGCAAEQGEGAAGQLDSQMSEVAVVEEVGLPEGLSDEPSLVAIPAHADEPATDINGGVPSFTDEELRQGTFEFYAPLDSLGRATLAFAMVGDETRPPASASRPSISSIRPSGWEQAQYDCVQGGSLYNRSHLIAWSLSDEGANPSNLITGTTYMNQGAMQGIEQSILGHVRNTGNHVLVRVTPIYEGDDLVARGVHYEAQSVEDDGAAVRVNAFLWNVQPGVAIDYATGASALVEEEAEPEGAVQGDAAVAGSGTGAGSAAGAAIPAAAGASASAGSSSSDSSDYVLNTNSKKFHRAGCSAVSKMKDKNKELFTGSRDAVIGRGYEPCKICNP